MTFPLPVSYWVLARRWNDSRVQKHVDLFKSSITSHSYFLYISHSQQLNVNIRFLHHHIFTRSRRREPRASFILRNFFQRRSDSPDSYQVSVPNKEQISTHLKPWPERRHFRAFDFRPGHGNLRISISIISDIIAHHAVIFPPLFDDRPDEGSHPEQTINIIRDLYSLHL